MIRAGFGGYVVVIGGIVVAMGTLAECKAWLRKVVAQMFTTVKYYLSNNWHYATFEYEDEAKRFIKTCKASGIEYKIFDTVERRYI